MSEAIEILEKRLQFLTNTYTNGGMSGELRTRIDEIENSIALLRAADAGIITRVGHNFVPAPTLEDVPF